MVSLGLDKSMLGNHDGGRPSFIFISPTPPLVDLGLIRDCFLVVMSDGSEARLVPPPQKKSSHRFHYDFTSNRGEV